MKKLLAGTLVVTMTLALFAALYGIMGSLSLDSTPIQPVRLQLASGVCSGANLGNGYILTAAHCADASADIVADTEKATVVWIDADKDLALLRAQHDLASKPVTLSCRPLVVGEPVTTQGHLLDLGVTFAMGYIAGKERTLGAWQIAHIAMLPIFFGNSGGPVFDDHGRVVAIAVGLIAPPIAIVVPIYPVCSQLPV